MIKPPSPRNGGDRLRTVQLYRIRDSGAEKPFDDLAYRAANDYVAEVMSAIHGMCSQCAEARQ